MDKRGKKIKITPGCRIIYVVTDGTVSLVDVQGDYICIGNLSPSMGTRDRKLWFKSLCEYDFDMVAKMIGALYHLDIRHTKDSTATCIKIEFFDRTAPSPQPG